ncbi:conserved hypothetical protein [Histoplasma capsulatum var. duboisii H88]|uniref:RING-type domain-containing protein n=2 Tax=Ajellomyces capsulatus TaxID=5037 RepID=F0UIJ2_AJEC8|nr:conserved hypothetical protein [Histoplasma capsulatum H143]EGC45597.1 conserved hypothetical protein [Histoplasma capsulatum var. duboisii H88]QSS56249.1 hypothetical protein I7I53_04410 [Histoplasma capsulatum var. duboisii H88]
MDLQSLSPRLRHFLVNRLDNPRSVGSEPFVQEDELCELLGVFPQYDSFTCFGRTSSSGFRCRNRISREQRHIAKVLLTNANQTFQHRDTNLRELMQDFEQIASNVLCHAYHQSQISRLATSWMLKTMQYQVLEFDIRQLRMEATLGSLVEAFNDIGERLRADGCLSAEAYEAGRIRPGDLNLGAISGVAEQETVGYAHVDGDGDEIEDRELEPESEPPPIAAAVLLVATQQPQPQEARIQPVTHAAYRATAVLNLVRRAARDGFASNRIRHERPRMPIKDDCQICQEPLVNERVEASLPSSSHSASSHSQALHESSELTYCSRGCGRNFHLDCMNTWIYSCINTRLPLTCPNCRCNLSGDS